MKKESKEKRKYELYILGAGRRRRSIKGRIRRNSIQTPFPYP